MERAGKRGALVGWRGDCARVSWEGNEVLEAGHGQGERAEGRDVVRGGWRGEGEQVQR